MRIYLDASVVVAAIVAEADTAFVIATLTRDPDTDWLVSDWVLTEVASALAIKTRTRQIADSDRVKAMAQARTLFAQSFTMLPVRPIDCRVATELIEVSRRPLRGGDALHLAIARAGEAGLWTLDKKLVVAGEALALDVRLFA